MVLSVLSEFATVRLGDARLEARLSATVGALELNPAASLPKAMATSAALEGAYRFIHNKRVNAEQVFAGHVSQTVARMAPLPRVRVSMDTTEVRFGGEVQRACNGVLPSNGQGFYLHLALASDPAHNTPLGVVAYQQITRRSQRADRHERGSCQADFDRADKESNRWAEVFLDAYAKVGDRGVYISDCEADSYTYLFFVLSKGATPLVRVKYDRDTTLEDGPEVKKLSQWLEGLPAKGGHRTVNISRRGKKIGGRTRSPSSLAKHPGRAGRSAHLELTAQTVVIPRPGHVSSDLPGSLTLNVVRAFEPSPPDGEEGVNWLLLTALPINTAEEIVAVVDHYKGRWLIEEFNKALKVGCALEERQLELEQSMHVMLAMLIPMAWGLLRLRSVARDQPQTEANAVLTPIQLDILKANHSERAPRRATTKPLFSDKPTAREAMLAVAALGGHIKANGDPGWAVLARGYQRLLTLEAGYILALRQVGHTPGPVKM